jgi:hypothetical protein
MLRGVLFLHSCVYNLNSSNQVEPADNYIGGVGWHCHSRGPFLQERLK